MDSVSRTSTSLRRPDIILFAAQIFIIVVVTVVSLTNLSLNIGNQNLWTVLLTSCMGIVMPNPKLKAREDINKSSFTDVTKLSNHGTRVLHDVELEQHDGVRQHDSAV